MFHVKHVGFSVFLSKVTQPIAYFLKSISFTFLLNNYLANNIGIPYYVSYLRRNDFIRETRRIHMYLLGGGYMIFAVFPVWSLFFSSIVLFLTSLLSVSSHFHELSLLLLSILGILFSSIIVWYWFLAAMTMDGLNTPENLPRRTNRFLFYTCINISFIISLFILLF